LCIACAVAAFAPPLARADEPVAAKQPRLLNETAEATTVVDAFDKDNPFDLYLTLGFRQSWKSASIRRETAIFQPGLTTGNFTARTENVAAFTQQVSILDVGADVGIYKDLALVFRMPLILDDSRELKGLDGSERNPERLQDPAGDQLFRLPFKSPSRSGVDWLSLGLNYAVLNQRRDATKPTWVVGVEGRFAVGPRLHACNDAATIKCPDPINPTQNRDPGISRGMHAVALHTTFSRRYGYVEPYSGFRMMAELPQSNSDFGASNDLKGSLLNHPPLLGTFTVGMEVIPWENREKLQRFVADLRFQGSYHSPGREYSELFDALGSSQARSLRNPNPGGYQLGGAGQSVVDPTAKKVYFTGITDQQAYSSFRAATSVTVQAGEFVKFVAGVGVTYAQSHLITSADACNPDLKNDAGAAGPCHGTVNGGVGPQPLTGVPNPNHRPVIDSPGRRFSVDDSTIVDMWINGVLMF
jgi:hypothetical protein